MELESIKYKKRLIAICVIVIISVLLGTIAQKQARREADYCDYLVETIQSTPEEEYNKTIEQKAVNEDGEKKHYTKEEALAVAQKMSDEYAKFFKYSNTIVMLIFAFAISGSIIGIMMYFIFTAWLVNKFWPDLNKVMSIILRIAALVILFYALFYILVTIGVFGQIPFVIYTLYKFIKLKKVENKDDIIKEN